MARCMLTDEPINEDDPCCSDPQDPCVGPDCDYYQSPQPEPTPYEAPDEFEWMDPDDPMRYL